MWDIMASNGIIHALASPLLTPPQSVSMGKGEDTASKGEGRNISGLVLDFASLLTEGSAGI